MKHTLEHNRKRNLKRSSKKNKTFFEKLFEEKTGVYIFSVAFAVLYIAVIVAITGLAS